MYMAFLEEEVSILWIAQAHAVPMSSPVLGGRRCDTGASTSRNDDFKKQAARERQGGRQSREVSKKNKKWRKKRRMGAGREGKGRKEREGSTRGCTSGTVAHVVSFTGMGIWG